MYKLNVVFTFQQATALGQHRSGPGQFCNAGTPRVKDCCGRFQQQKTRLEQILRMVYDKLTLGRSACVPHPKHFHDERLIPELVHPFEQVSRAQCRVSPRHRKQWELLSSAS